MHNELLVSTDRGETWSPLCIIREIGGAHCTEPCFCELEEGTWLVQFRTGEWTGGKPYHVLQTASEDQGETWTEPRLVDVKGYPPVVVEHSNGNLYSFFGIRHGPYGVRGMVSEDRGKTWDTGDPVSVAEDGAHKDLGYPSAVELEDGTLLVVYYINDDRDPFPYIRGTILSP